MSDNDKKKLADREGDSPLKVSHTKNKPKEDVPEVDEVVKQGQAGHMMYKNQQQEETDSE